MLFQSCPQCQKQSLVPTGAFWSCTYCGTAITSQALSAMKATNHRRATLLPCLDGRSTAVCDKPP